MIDESEARARNSAATGAGPDGSDNLIEQVDALLNKGVGKLRFPDPIEARFNAEIEERHRRRHAVMGLIGCLLYDAFLIQDIQMVPDIFTYVLWVRLGIITPILLGLALINWRVSLSVSTREILVSTVATMIAATLVLFMLKTHSVNASHYYIGMPLILIYNNTVQRIRFRYALWVSLSIVLLSAWGLAQTHLIPAAAKQTFISVLITTSILTLIALHRIEADERYTFLLRLREAHLARHDALTGLPNRRALEEHLTAQLQQLRTIPDSLYLMFLDLDHFKVVNDSCGHAAGDRLLCEVANVWKPKLRRGDFIARVGGDEFAIVLRNLPEWGARDIGEQLIAATDRYRFVNEDSKFTIGLSVGLVMLDGSSSNLTDLFIQADMACYAAKRQGRGRLSQYRSEDAEIVFVKRTVDWGPRIRRALDENRFRLYLQKIVDSDGACEGYEALVRLIDEQGKTIAPGEFLPPAKRLGLMTTIDRWVCSSIIAQLKRETLPAGYISVNLMPSSISDTQFANWLLSELRKNPGFAGRLRFEVIETEELRIGVGELALFRALHEMGFGLFLDDFGSGYNSFDLVKRLPLDGIKLDGIVVGDCMTDPVDQSLVLAAVSIARRMKLKLVAEGVENRVVLQALKTIGVPSFQGYLFHRPEPIENLCAERQSIAAVLSPNTSPSVEDFTSPPIPRSQLHG
jgi:diguanylate cyclase (GGDEF)-like protein